MEDLITHPDTHFPFVEESCYIKTQDFWCCQQRRSPGKADLTPLSCMLLVELQQARGLAYGHVTSRHSSGALAPQ